MTVLSNIGVPAAGDVMNLVVLTAAMSSLNSGLYSTGRILRSMAMAGSAPRFAGRDEPNQVPYGGILLTAAACVLGVGLNYVDAGRGVRDRAELRGDRHPRTWGMIMVMPPPFRPQGQDGRGDPARASGCRARPGHQIATLAFLVSVVVLMAFDESGRIVLAGVPVIVLALVVGWFGVRRRIDTSVLEKSA